MKKILPLVLIPVLAAGAFLVWQNLPTKRFARHMVKARLFSKENNLTAARLEYEKAFAVRGNYTPYVDLEVLNYYVWMEFEKYSEYRRNTVYYFVGEGMDEMLLLAPPDFPLLKTSSPVTLSQLFSAARDWVLV